MSKCIKPEKQCFPCEINDQCDFSWFRKDEKSSICCLYITVIKIFHEAPAFDNNLFPSEFGREISKPWKVLYSMTILNFEIFPLCIHISTTRLSLPIIAEIRNQLR
jgi:hypothetical protein